MLINTPSAQGAPAPTVPGPAATPPPDGAPAAPDAAPGPPDTDKAPPPEDAQKVDFTARFAALTKKERTITERERAIKTREADPDFATFKKAKENARVDPMGLLEAHGWSFDDLTQFVISDRKLTPDQQIKLMQEELRADKDARTAADDARKAADDAAVVAAEQEAIDRHKVSIRDAVDTSGDRFELVRLNEAHELVWDVIEEHWKDTGGNKGGEILPIEDAAEMVEAYLEKQARDKILKAKKFAPKEDVKPDGSPAQTRAPTTPPPTLTNRAVTGASPVEALDTSGMSDDESKRRAASLLRWS